MEDLLSGVRDVFIEGNYMWIISDNFNCLFGYDFTEQRLDLITVFPETDRKSTRLNSSHN